MLVGSVDRRRSCYALSAWAALFVENTPVTVCRVTGTKRVLDRWVGRMFSVFADGVAAAPRFGRDGVLVVS